ncbi:hypothetical protein J4219_03665 [Candidatus Woesearchaeota archaeon]|nr:hypothetical protein [Candidatus Woesearchaeota archaeon]
MKHTYTITLLLFSLFITAHLIGLGVINSYLNVTPEGVEWKSLPSIAGVEVERPDVAPQYSIWYILFAVLFGTVLILFIIKFKTMMLWKIWFTLAVTLCLFIAFAAFVRPSFAFSLALVLGLIKVFKPNIYVHNLTEIFVYGGLAAIFVPILDVMYAFILLLLLSVYDMYAVWKSKHMVSMAQFQTKSGIFAGLLIPYSKTGISVKTTSKTAAKQTAKSVKTAVLGGGDIGFPLIFSGTVLAASGFVNAFIVSLFAGLALMCLLLLSQKDKFYPAMPFLTAGCVAGFLVTLLI